MDLSREQSRLFVPDGAENESALQRITHLGIAAHPDDLKFMAWRPILDCFEDEKFWFCGVVVSDGGDPSQAHSRSGNSEEELALLHLEEQRRAATTGKYGAAVALMHPETGEAMAGTDLRPLIDDLKTVISTTEPRFIVTHNLADSDPHHLVVATATVYALRELDYLPQQFYGGEVWRSLDWLPGCGRLLFDVSHHDALISRLMGSSDSEKADERRIDLATAGRKRANATYCDPLSTDTAIYMEYGMDLLPLLRQTKIEPHAYVATLIEQFKLEVTHRLQLYGQRLDRAVEDSGS